MKKKTPPTLAEQLQRLSQQHEEVSKIYGENWQAGFGLIKGRNCTVVAGLDAELATYLATLHRVLPQLVALIEAQKEGL